MPAAVVHALSGSLHATASCCRRLASQLQLVTVLRRRDFTVACLVFTAGHLSISPRLALL